MVVCDDIVARYLESVTDVWFILEDRETIKYLWTRNEADERKIAKGLRRATVSLKFIYKVFIEKLN